MTYKLMVNQPFNCTYNVLSATIHFLLCFDHDLKRLEEKWRCLPEGIGLYDSFNRKDVLVGIPLSEGEEVKEYNNFYAYDQWYKPHPNLTRSQLDDFLEVVNDYYGDIFFVARTPIGYGYYKAVKTFRDR